MEQELHDAHEELKRVDHLIYVSLKYTRTVDVLKNVLKRLIACFDCVLDDILQKAEDENRILEAPTAPRAKVIEVRNIYPEDEVMIKFLDFYLLLRDLDQAEYTKSQEFRRHVTMHTQLEAGNYDVNIDVVTEYYKQAKDYLEHINGLLSPDELSSS